MVKITSLLPYKVTKKYRENQINQKKNRGKSLRFQIGILDVGRGQYTKYLPYAFTEQGLAMLSGILNSDIAIYTNISIMRAFVAIRQNLPIISTQKELEDLKQRIKALEESD